MTPPPNRSRRLLAALAALLLVLGVLAFLHFRGGGTKAAHQAAPAAPVTTAPERPLPRERRAPAGTPAADTDAPGAAPPDLVFDDPDSPVSSKKDPRARAQFFLDQAAEYRERAKFPKNNEPLFKGGTDPIAVDNHPVRREDRARGMGPSLVLTAKASQVVYPAPVVVQAFLQENGTRMPVELTAELAKGPPNPIPEHIKLAMVDDGRGSDTAGDLIYTWELAPSSPAEAEKWSGLHTIYVIAHWGDDPANQIGSSITWEYSAPAGATLTGHYRDSMVDGSLRIEAEVKVDQPGRYHLQLALAGPDDKLLAWAQNDSVNEFAQPTVVWIPITVYGYLLSQAGVDGPYKVKRIWLKNVSLLPPKVTAPVEDAYTTRAYRAAQFTTKPFNDPVDLAHAAEAEQNGKELLEDLAQHPQGPTIPSGPTAPPAGTP